MRIYMDNCCFNRIFDDRRIIRNYLEREAILIIFQKVFTQEVELVGSDVLKIEMSNTGSAVRKECLMRIYETSISSEVAINDEIKDRAHNIQDTSNIKAFDSLHLASAENNADIFLTTDRKFLNAAKKLSGLKIRIENPIYFAAEVILND